MNLPENDEPIALVPQQAASLHMRNVILWTNGMCMVFDDQGEQMPEYQGPFEVVAPRINAVFSGSWEYGDWARGILSSVPLPRLHVTVSGGKERSDE